MILQIIVNATANALLLSMVALGFHLIFATTRVFHLAHGAVYVAGFYVFFTLNPILGVIPAVMISLTASAGIGILIEKLVYSPISSKSSSSTITLISSLAVYIILTNTIAMIFGNETVLVDNLVREGYLVAGITVTQTQSWQLFIGAIVLVLFFALIFLTDIGIRIRAISDNPILAKVMGIPIQKTRMAVFGIGSILAASSSMLKGFDTGIDPFSGMNVTLYGAVAFILGGGKIFGATLLAAFFLSFAFTFSEFYISSQWRDAIAFSFLLLALLFRSQGILQITMRADER